MGGTRSYSKRKSSPRKTSKLSSEARRKKRSRRTKSKKLRHRDDSSSNSSDQSRSSVSISSSSSEDEKRRACSRTGTGVKGSRRKRTRRNSSGHGSSEENYHHVKKRNGLKKSANSDSKKKSQRKKRKREPSVSSGSSDSPSEFERPRGRSREKINEKRNSGNAKSGTKSNKSRSRSCSPCTRFSDCGEGNSKDVLPVENSVRRLRSVITVVKSPEGEEKQWEQDGHIEEIAYDHDDYPSCRSNDSNEGGSKSEIASLDLETKRVENVKGGEALVSDIRMTKNKKTVEEGAVRDSHSNSLSGGAGANIYSKETKVDIFPSISSENGDDLESVLRLKALENLKKYRDVRLQTNVKPPADDKTKSDNGVKRLSTAKVEFVENSSTNEDDSRVVGATRMLDQNPSSKMGRGSSLHGTSYGKGQEGKGIATKRGMARHSVISLPSKVAISGNSKVEDPSPASKSDLGKSASKQEASDTILNVTHEANMFVTQKDLEKSSVEKSTSVGQTGGNNYELKNVGESSTSQPSSLKPTLEEQNSKDQQGGQFEQKTMSVMRGGEMVEVSYKVYIPKKAPALSRRHLQR